MNERFMKKLSEVLEAEDPNWDALLKLGRNSQLIVSRLLRQDPNEICGPVGRQLVIVLLHGLNVFVFIF